MDLFKPVAAYSFRGDTRAPEAIKAACGFQPPCTRTDFAFLRVFAKEFLAYLKRRAIPGFTIPDEDEMMTYILELNPIDRKLLSEYYFWCGVLEREQNHLQAMTIDPFMKGYISTTRDVRKAHNAANGCAAGGATAAAAAGNDAMAQTIRMLDGNWVYALRIESGFLIKPGVGGITKDEAEIAHLGPLSWNQVYGFARNGRLGEGTVYIRGGFELQDYGAFLQVLGALSSVVGGN
jgi:hypothetical protein